MAYTPINWQNGDIITAAKLNRCDNGWSVEASSTTLCEESVTTVSGQMGYNAALAYSTPLSEDTLIVTFSGTEYTCSKMTAGSAIGYGGFTAQGTDFSVYPFALVVMNGTNYIYTSSAGTYTVKLAINGTVIETSSDYNLVRGWSVDSTQLFNETLTTASSNMGYSASMAYTGDPTTLGTLTITFDGTEYTCTQYSDSGQYWWGAPTPSDFSTYPFVCLAMNGHWYLITETAGTYTISALAETISTGSDFESAVNSVVDTSLMPMLCVSNTTTRPEMRVAYETGKLLYFKPYESGASYCFITGFSTTSVNFIPENANITVSFVNDVFKVVTS